MDDDADLSSLGFTSFGNQKNSHTSLPIHARQNQNEAPLTTATPPAGLPAKPPLPPQQQQYQQSQDYNQNQNFHHNSGNYRGRGGGGPHRSRGFHSQGGQGQGRGRGRGRGGFRGGAGGHHHPYSNPQQQQQLRDFSTNPASQVKPYRSDVFGEGLYKPSMDDDPWRYWSDKGGKGAVAVVEAGTSVGGEATVGDGWRGQSNLESADADDEKGRDEMGGNPEEIELDDDDI